MSKSTSRKIQIPKAFKELFEPKRFKIYYGGRGGAKSHNFARALLIRCMKEPTRVLCARELQGSINDSVHKLLSDIIDYHELNSFFEVQKSTIKGANGSEFIFKGLKHNATEIKSTEGVDVAWIEEAEKVSANSWEILIPTIRKEGSEIWISFNPKHPTDPTYVNFVERADDDMLVRKVSWRDNPFFPSVLDDERRRLQKNDPKAYDHVWEGNFDERHFGGIYASYIDKARTEGRICPAPHKSGIPVYTGWDLGRADSTAIWFAQIVGLQVRVIDYYENSNEDLEHYADVLRSKGYTYKPLGLPHDAKHQRLGMNGKSISQQFRDMGFETQVLGVSKKFQTIEEGRNLLKECYIDETKCKDGIHVLTNYQYMWDENRNTFKDSPLHDWTSHGADAWGELAKLLNSATGRQAEIEDDGDYYSYSVGGDWMS